uniref:Uncharacterized protein n=1 Tax=Opuntia streptacantha TaxID=393608 RepID=A0A7C8ZB84_OPUST
MLSISSSSSFSNTLNSSRDTFPFLSPPSSSSSSSSSITFKRTFKCPQFFLFLSSRKPLFLPKSSDPDADSEDSTQEDEWLSRLPDKNKPLYAHSLPCIEAWLRSLGFYQSKEDRAVWFIERPDWHAQLSLDITDLYIRS